MYALLQQDSLASPLSYHWSLPPTTLIKSSLGRAARLSEQTKHWQNVPTPELQECLRHILSLLPREVISSENQRLWQMQPAVVLDLLSGDGGCQATLHLGLSKHCKGMGC